MSTENPPKTTLNRNQSIGLALAAQAAIYSLVADIVIVLLLLVCPAFPGIVNKY